MPLVFMFTERIWQDLRHGWRVFAKNPGFAAIAVISIALGTGANVAVFSAADALILRPLPVPRPGELAHGRFAAARREVESQRRIVSGLRGHRAIAPASFDGLVAFTSRTTGFSARPGAPLQVKTATVVTWNFFRVLGVEPELGRGFLPEGRQVGGRNAVTILSYGVWQQEFCGDPAVLGRKVRIAGIDFTIIGVAPERFTGAPADFVREAALRAAWRCGRA